MSNATVTHLRLAEVEAPDFSAVPTEGREAACRAWVTSVAEHLGWSEADVDEVDGCEVDPGEAFDKVLRTTATLTLAAFLEQRIAETERRCGDVHHVNCAYVCVLERDCTCGNPARVLAECAAKRRIVRAYESANLSSGVDYELGFGLDLAVRALASVYADHEAFDPEWAL